MSLPETHFTPPRPVERQNTTTMARSGGDARKSVIFPLWPSNAATAAAKGHAGVRGVSAGRAVLRLGSPRGSSVPEKLAVNPRNLTLCPRIPPTA